MDDNARLKELLSYLRLKPISPEELNLLLTVVLALIVVFVLIEVILYLYRRQKRLKEAWDWFYQLCQAKDLSVNEMKVLRELAHCSKSQNPANLLKSITAFDRAVDKKFLSCKLPPRDRDHLDLEIRELRTKLMFADLPPDKILTTTHGITEGQQFRLELFIEEQLYFYYTSVCKVAEKDIEIFLPVLPGQNLLFEKGQKVDVYFWRPRDAGYRFSTEIIDISEGPPALLILAHTDKIDREQSRHYYRVDVILPIFYHLLTPKEIEAWERNGIFSFDENFKPHEGRVISLSGGGVSYSGAVYTGRGELLWIELQLSDTKKIASLVGRVVRIKKIQDNVFKTTVEFAHISETQREDIMRYIAVLQRRRIHLINS